jgi:hypothetical protein
MNLFKTTVAVVSILKQTFLHQIEMSPFSNQNPLFKACKSFNLLNLRVNMYLTC